MPPVIVVLLVLAAAAAAVSSPPGAAAAAAVYDAGVHLVQAVYGPIRLTAEQQAVARVIADRAAAWCRANGIPRPRTLAAVLLANAWAESRLNPRAVGDGGASLGLFQLNTAAGVGKSFLAAHPELVRDDLFDPGVNTDGILSAMAKSSSTLDRLRSGTLAEVTDRFVRYVERPADVDARSLERQAYAEHFAGVPKTTPTAQIDAPPLA